jgi:peptidoglycan-associated lipoprotein
MKRRFGARAAGAAALGLGFVLALAGCQTSGTSSASGSGTGTGEWDDGSSGSGGGSGTEAASVLQPVYFDYDRAEIRSDARPTLRSNGDAVNANTDWGTVTVEGHCDERGSEEYNLALGDRRASRVRDYLVDLGVSSSRLRTVSFGESKPAVMGHDESAWRYNRRVEFTAR